MRTNKKQLLIALLVMIAICALLTVFVLYTLQSDKIPSNPPGTIGNTAGNLNNSGLFCESDGVVYFSNSFDGGALYSMSSTETNFKKLNETNTRNILAGGDYLYYFQTGSAGSGSFVNVKTPASFNYCKKNGDNIKTITRSIIVNAQLSGNDLYMLDNNNNNPCFRKIRTDKSEDVIIADYIVNPSCAVDRFLYYNGTVSDHYLYAMDTTSGLVTTVLDYNLWFPAIEGDYVYFLDIENNYRICRYPLSGGAIEVLYPERVDCFNVGNGYIYFQTNGNQPKLMWMYTDGSNPTVVAEGIYTNINMTSKYVYVQLYGDSSALYHTALGTSNLDIFYNASVAAQ